MTDRPPVTAKRDGRVTTLTLDRPATRNAFDQSMFEGVSAALREAAGDDRVRVVVVTGANDAFSSGADTRQLSSPDAGSADAGRPFHALLDTLEEFPKPLVAAVPGVAVGLGLTVLSYFDVVIASDRARFRAPFVLAGLTPEAGSSWALPRLIGWQNSAYALFTGAWIEASDAERVGLVWRVVAHADLPAAARGVATEIGAAPLTTLVEIKQLLSAARGTDRREARQRESSAFRRLLDLRHQGTDAPPAER